MRADWTLIFLGMAALCSACSGGNGDGDDDDGEGGAGSDGGGSGASHAGNAAGGTGAGRGGSSAGGSGGGSAGSGKGGSAGNDDPAPTRDPLDLNAPSGTLGGRCEEDADCADHTLKCIAPAGFAAGTKYCAPTCEVADDCQDFANTSYAIPVPLDPDGFGNNAWNSTTLARGAGCAVSPQLGGTQKYCQFLCVENSAANSDFTTCSCLPRYKTIRNAEDDLVRCDWDDASQCSPLGYPGRRNVCDACNSTPLFDGCYMGKYFCQFNRNFNGDCKDGSLDIGSLEACIGTSTSDCDPTCYEACTGGGGDSYYFEASDRCVDACCTSSDRPASEAPECTSGSGTGGGPGSGGTSSSGGSAGTSGGAAGTSGKGGSSSEGGDPGISGMGGTGTKAGGASSGGASSAGTKAGGASSGGASSAGAKAGGASSGGASSGGGAGAP